MCDGMLKTEKVNWSLTDRRGSRTTWRTDEQPDKKQRSINRVRIAECKQMEGNNKILQTRPKVEQKMEMLGFKDS